MRTHDQPHQGRRRKEGNEAGGYVAKELPLSVTGGVKGRRDCCLTAGEVGGGEWCKLLWSNEDAHGLTR